MYLSAMVFAADADTQARIQRRCVTSGDIITFRSPDYRPNAQEILRAVNAYGPELALIEFQDKDDALRIVGLLQAQCPHLAILGFADNWPYEPSVISVKVVPTSIQMDDFRQAVAAAVNAVRIPGPDNLIVFMPSKAGVGASTLALNVTGALANKCGKSAILIESDLHSGPAGMYLNLDPTYSVIDALLESHRLDGNWDHFVTHFTNFSILPAWNTRSAVPMISPWAYRRLVSYARQRYEYVIFDLPEVVNQATEVLVTNAKSVYMVCTPEVPSLILARKRAAALVERGVPKERLQIVLNRYSKDGPDAAAIAEILESPIAQVIPNDYKSLWAANLERRLVDENSLVGKAFQSFAWNLTGRVEPRSASRKLFGLFSAA